MKWSNITEFKGMSSLRNATELPVGVCAFSLNSNMGSSSQAAPMAGYSKLGNQANPTDKIARKFTFVRGDGVEIMLQVRDDGTNYILEYLNLEDIRNSQFGEWSILEAGLSRSNVLTDGSTKKAYFGFAPFNDTGSDQLVYGNGIETNRVWSGATAEVASTTATTITIDGATGVTGRGFGSTGTLVINGTTYTYTTISGNEFQSVTPNPTGEADGSGIAEKPDTAIFNSEDKSSIILSTQSRLFVAGISATPNQVNFSDIGDITSWAGSNPSDGGFEDFPQMNGNITALSYIDEWVIVFSEKKIIAFRFDFPSSTTRTVLRRDIADEGCSNPKAVRKMGSQVWYVTPKGGIKVISQIAEKDVFNVLDLTDDIRPTIRDFIWDDAALEYSTKDRVWFAAGKSNDIIDDNDRAVMVWLSRDLAGNLITNIGICDWFIGDMCIFQGDLHFGSSLQSENFRAFDGFSKNGASYIWRRTERIEMFGDPWKRKRVSHLGIIGAISSGTTLKIRIKYGINGKDTVSEMIITGTDEPFVSNQPLNTLNGFELGTEPLGGTVAEIGQLNAFEVVFPLINGSNPRNIQIEFETDGEGQQAVIDYYSLRFDDGDQQLYTREMKALGL